MKWFFFSGIFVSLLVGGCRVGPRYEPPTTEIPAEWKYPHDAPNTPLVDYWWEVFNDDGLNCLAVDQSSGRQLELIPIVF